MSDSRAEAVREALESGASQLDADVVRGLLDAYDERLRVNVGLVRENAELRKARS